MGGSRAACSDGRKLSSAKFGTTGVSRGSEQNYIRRPLDLLRVHHEKIEAWILQQAKVKFKVKPAGPVTVAARPTRKLRLVGTGVASLL